LAQSDTSVQEAKLKRCAKEKLFLPADDGTHQRAANRRKQKDFAESGRISAASPAAIVKIDDRWLRSRGAGFKP
jgi:hypothetical protein